MDDLFEGLTAYAANADVIPGVAQKAGQKMLMAQCILLKFAKKPCGVMAHL